MITTYHTIYNNVCRTAHTRDLQVFCGEVYIAIDSQCFTIGALPEVQAVIDRYCTVERHIIVGPYRGSIGSDYRCLNVVYVCAGCV
jgi:hypothetical protein